MPLKCCTFFNKSLLNLLLSTRPLDTILEFRPGEQSGFGFTLKAAPHIELTPCMFLFSFSLLLQKLDTNGFWFLSWHVYMEFVLVAI